MFRCTTSPREPSFPTTLQGLNMVFSTAGQPVDVNTGAPFSYYHDKNDRITDLHKEAFHTAISGEMKLKLAEYGVKEHYITARNQLLIEKPAEKHVPVLMSEVSTVQTSRDIIIIVGESSQECGALAWRLVREPEGLKRGTVVGLVDAVADCEAVETPAVVVLNPGQLIYSYKDNCAKTLVGWRDSPRVGHGYAPEIDEENKMEGKCFHLFLIILSKLTPSAHQAIRLPASTPTASWTASSSG